MPGSTRIRAARVRRPGSIDGKAASMRMRPVARAECDLFGQERSGSASSACATRPAVRRHRRPVGAALHLGHLRARAHPRPRGEAGRHRRDSVRGEPDSGATGRGDRCAHQQRGARRPRGALRLVSIAQTGWTGSLRSWPRPRTRRRGTAVTGTPWDGVARGVGPKPSSPTTSPPARMSRPGTSCRTTPVRTWDSSRCPRSTAGDGDDHPDRGAAAAPGARLGGAATVGRRWSRPRGRVPRHHVRCGCREHPDDPSIAGRGAPGRPPAVARVAPSIPAFRGARFRKGQSLIGVGHGAGRRSRVYAPAGA